MQNLRAIEKKKVVEPSKEKDEVEVIEKTINKNDEDVKHKGKLKRKDKIKRKKGIFID